MRRAMLDDLDGQKARVVNVRDKIQVILDAEEVSRFECVRSFC